MRSAPHDPIDAFRNAIATAGLTPPEQIHADGRLHRFSTNGKASDDAGWYVLHINSVPAGRFGCHRHQIDETWCARKPADMSDAERATYRRAMDDARRQREAERDRRQAEARKRAERLWHESQPETGEHRYLKDKGVQAHGIRTDGQRLLVPRRDTDGTLHSLQYIDPAGAKRYLTGGRVKGCYHAIGEPNEILCIAEGYATAASIHEATDHAVAVAFDAGNLLAVAKALRAKYPDLRLIVCADDDYRTAGNPGLTKATAAAGAVGGLLAVPECGDERPDGATDFNDMAAHHGLDAVRACIENAKAPARDDQSTSDKAPVHEANAAIRRLAALSPIEYDRCRQAEAKRLGVRVGTLDAEVSRLRPHPENEPETGEAVLFDEPEAWPDPVDGAALLDDLADTFTRYLVLPNKACDALALWAAHTYVYDAFEHTPRLNITAPVKGCGKTLLLDVLQALVAKGLRTENVSTAVTFRLIEAQAPTLLIDEYDSFLRDNEALRGALNAGHRRGGQHLRCVGDDHKVKGFRTFAPLALAGIGALPGTLADRSIVVRMERAKPDEVRERFDSRKTQRERELKRKLIRWAQDNRKQLEACDPELPGLYNRRADNWRPLFAVAECVGGEWPEKVKKAVKALTDKSDENESAGVLLLADIRRIFENKRHDWFSSAEIIDELLKREDSPWQEWRKGKAITQAGIARLLKPFGIRPKQHRYKDGRTGISSYQRSSFDSAFSRYLLPVEPADQTSTPLQPAPHEAFGEFQSSTQVESVELTKTLKPAPHKACRGVELSKAGNGTKVWGKPTFEFIPNLADGARLHEQYPPNETTIDGDVWRYRTREAGIFNPPNGGKGGSAGQAGHGCKQSTYGGLDPDDMTSDGDVWRYRI